MSAAQTRKRRESPTRLRILETATTLFYAEGVQAVGIDRIIATASVAKATFYHHFPAKDELVRAYVERQSQIGRTTIVGLAPRPPRDMILSIFDLIADTADQPGYRGCPFQNAAAEYPDPDSPVRRAIDDHRRWKRGLFKELLIADANPDPDRTANVLAVTEDGLLVVSHLDKPADLRALVRDTVNRVLGASLAVSIRAGSVVE